MRRQWKWLWLGVGILLAAGAAYGWRSAEGIVLCGSASAKVELCRALPHLAAVRREILLRWLLSDAAAEVRSAAVTAWEKSGRPAALSDMLLNLLQSESETPDVRVKAGLALLASAPPEPRALAYAQAQSSNPDFRRKCGWLVARAAELSLTAQSAEERRALLAAALDEDDPAHEALQAMARRQSAVFRFRDVLLKRLAQPASPGTRQFILAALAESEGAMRGHRPEDWEISVCPEAGDDSPQAVEAEWATEIKPNYQIAKHEGVWCLALGEGAGGYMSWLKGHEGTVDIGTARLSLYAPRPGKYALWARVWFDDKCGNSFGCRFAGQALANFSDGENILRQWHWLPLYTEAKTGVELSAGFHVLELEAWEDGVYLDRFALLPEGERPEALPDPPAVRWDPAVPLSLSIAPEYQAQPRGTEQTVVVWVRRHSPLLKGGTVEIRPPPGFAVAGPCQADVVFAPGNPLARASFTISLPDKIAAGEDWLRAVYRDANGASVENAIILGAAFDWLTTGSLNADDPLARKLADVAGSGAGKYARRDWSPLPIAAYDPYRRLDVERAFGQLENKIIYLCADIEVGAAGMYMVFLTADDAAQVYLDDRLLIAQVPGGPGEGRLVTLPANITAGKHRLFVRLRQGSGADPVGPDAGRHTFNHCNFKLLLRRSRHEPAPEIRGLPHPLRP